MKHIETPQPPRTAEALLRLRVRPPAREFVLGDLAEGFDQVARARGARAARRWYWQQTMRCLLSSPHKGTVAPLTDAGPGRLPPLRRHMAALVRDIGFAMRTIGRAPAASAAAVVTFALGLGANVAVFSVAWPVLVEPLPFPDEDRLVRIDLVFSQRGREYRNPISPGDYTDLRAVTSFEALAGFNQFTSEHNLIGIGDPDRIELGFVTHEFFGVLGITPLAGRVLDQRDGSGDGRAVVLNERIWRRQWGGNPAIVGRAINLDGAPYTVVGIVPETAGLGTRDADAWTVMTIEPTSRIPRRGYFLGMVGRLRPELSLDRANHEIRTVMARAAAQYPDINQHTSADAMPLREMLVGPIRATLQVLLIAAGVVLVIAGINLAGLQVARHLRRAQEIEIRRALGASRARLVGQLLTEGVVLAAFGGAAGLLCAWLTLRALTPLQPQMIWHDSAARLDGPVLAYTSLLTVLTGLIVAAVPAWRASRREPHAMTSSLRATSGHRTRRASSIVVATQVSMTVLLLIGASLVGISLARVLTVNPGFEFDRGIVADLALPVSRYPNPAARARFFDDLLGRIEAVPGVSRACVMNNLPLDNPGYNMTFVADGDTRLVGSHPKTASAGCFDALQIPLLRGRFFETVEPEPVAIVSQSMARQLWPDGIDPVGRTLRVGLPTGDRLTVIGVVGDIRNASLESRFMQQVWLPTTLPYFPPQRLIVGSRLPPEALASAIRGAMRDLDPGLALARIRTMPEIVATITAPRRFVLVLLGAFAAVALVLCAVGIYGVLAQLVGQRTREIGIRMALGAHRASVLRLVISRVSVAVGAGAAAGLVAAWMVADRVAHLLFEVSARDRRVYLAVVSFVAAISAVAAWAPARRAARVDPVTALRAE